MVMALGIGAYVAAVFHLIAHAFFKALLFLGSGSVIHGVEHGMHHAAPHTGTVPPDEHDALHEPPPPEAVVAASVPASRIAADPHDPQDMRNMGALRERMPLTFWTFLAGTLALTGIPIFAGFWSKDEILAEAFHKGLEQGVPIAVFVWLLGTAAAFLTAFYMARQVFLVFFGAPSSEGARHAPESAPAMVYPLVVLAFFATFLGLVGIPEDLLVLPGLGANPFHAFLGALTMTGEHFPALAFKPLPALISIAMAAAGWGLGWLIYGRQPVRARARDPLQALGGLWMLLHRKYYVDELYDATVVRGSILFANVNALVDRYLVDGLVNGAGVAGEWFSRVNGWIDRYIVDGLVNLVGYISNEMARGLQLIQSGRVQQYVLVVFFGLLFLVGAYIF
jgi:NADH-quinone oxidoreductase subunit L